MSSTKTEFTDRLLKRLRISKKQIDAVTEAPEENEGVKGLVHYEPATSRYKIVWCRNQAKYVAVVYYRDLPSVRNLLKAMCSRRDENKVVATAGDHLPANWC